MQSLCELHLRIKYAQGPDIQDDSIETVQRRVESINSVYLDDRIVGFSLMKKGYNFICCV